MLLLLLSHFSHVRLCVTPETQPTRLPRPWDSPGKNTGVGCHFLLQCMKVESESEVAQLCPTLSDPMDCNLPGSSIHGIFQARVLEWGANDFSPRRYICICLLSHHIYYIGYLGSSVVKNPPANAGDMVQSLCLEDPLEKEMATHSRILAWEIPWLEDPGWL